MSRRSSSRAVRPHRPLRHKMLRLEALEDRRVMALAIAENLLVSLDANSATAGSANWANAGTLGGNFTETGNAIIQGLGPNANPAVMFNGGEVYSGPVAPAGIGSGGATRTIEVWAFNPSFDKGEETMVGWGRRGGPDGSNVSFNNSTNAAFGAVGHWGGPDIGWGDTVGNVPLPGQWHHLVYTYDGTFSRVYADGQLSNQENVGFLNTHSGFNIRIGSQNDGGGNIDFGQTATLGLGVVRIHDGVLTPAQILNNYAEDAAKYGKYADGGAPTPAHRYSFTADGSDSIGGATAQLFNGANVVGGQLQLLNTLNDSNDPNGQYANLPIGATVGSGASLTVEGWFTMTGYANWSRLFDFGPTARSTNDFVFFAPSRDVGGVASAEVRLAGGANGIFSGPTATPLNTETHVAVVVDSANNELRLYINGSHVATDSNILPFSPRALGNTAFNYLGRSMFPDAYFRGSINEFRVYNQPLSSAQVLSSFTAGPNALNSAPVAGPDTYTTNESASFNVTNFNPTTAYNVPAGTVGNQSFDGALGMDFDVGATPIYVTQLGVFDSGSNGITGQVTARLYNRATGTLVPGAVLDFTGNAGTLVGGSRFQTLTTPILLPAGFQGTIVGEGYAAELNGNSGTPPWTTNGGGLISFVGAARYNLTKGLFPGTADGGPANRYAAGTFTFSATPPGQPTLLANDTDANGNTLIVLPTTNVSVINANFNDNIKPSNIILNSNTGGTPTPNPTFGLVQNGRAELTQAANGQMATMLINKPAQTAQSFTATFNMLIGNPGGDGADGVSFAYGPMLDTALFGENFGGFPGLQVQFDTHDNGGGEAPSFKLVYNNVEIAPRVNVAANLIETNSFVPVSITVNAAGQVTVVHNGVTRFNNVQIPGWAPAANWRFAIGSRTGGLNERAYIDDLAINGATAANVAIPVINANFDDNAQPANVLFNRTPAVPAVQNYRLELTHALNDLLATAIISKPNPSQILHGINATFDMLIGNPAGNGADGVNFVYGDIPDNALFGENFGGNGVQVQFDTHDNGGGEAPAIKLVYQNTFLGRVNFPEAGLETNSFVPVQISISPTGQITVRHNNNLVFNNVQIPDWNPQASWRFAIGSRTGGLNERAYIDNLNISGTARTEIQSTSGATVNINSDGTFSYDPTTSASLNTLSQGQIFNDTFNYTVFDGSATVVGTATVAVIGVNDPIVSTSAGGPYTVNEGQATGLTVAPSAVDVDTNDVFTFSWDLDNDGAFDDATTTALDPVITVAELDAAGLHKDGPVTRAVRVRASDGLTTVDSAPTNIIVNNRVPTVVIGGPSSGVIGQPLDFTFTATDPSPVDQAAGFVFAIDLDGNGSFETTIPRTANNGTQPFTQAFSAPGTYTLRATATDKDGGTSVLATHVVTVATAIDDNGTLIVGGTSGSDRIVIQSGTFGVKVVLNGTTVGNFPGVTEGLIFGGAGNDTISVGNLRMAFTIDGGDDNDYITGGPLADTLLGGGGSDRLLGGGGDDFLFGGDDNDTVDGGVGNDTIDGESGNDNVRGGNGNDTALGGEGNDRVNGDAGNDILLGGAGADTVDGGNGNDALGGGEDSDKLYGRAGNDVLVGGEALDYLYGGAGDDMILGSLAGDESEDGLAALLVAWQGATGSTQAKANAVLGLVGADEDDAGDTLYGETGGDWFMAFLNDAVHKTDRSSPNYTDKLA